MAGMQRVSEVCGGERCSGAMAVLPVEPGTAAWGGWRCEMGGLMAVAGTLQTFTYSASLTDT